MHFGAFCKKNPLLSCFLLSFHALSSLLFQSVTRQAVAFPNWRAFHHGPDESTTSWRQSFFLLCTHRQKMQSWHCLMTSSQCFKKQNIDFHQRKKYLQSYDCLHFYYHFMLTVRLSCINWFTATFDPYLTLAITCTHFLGNKALVSWACCFNS